MQIDKSDYAMGYSGSGNSMAPYLGHKAALQILGDPVRPPRNRVAMSVGRRWLWVKKVHAPLFTIKMNMGRV